MSDWKHVVLQPDELLLLQPCGTETPEEIEGILAAMPDALRGRVLCIDPTSVEVMIVRKLEFGLAR